MSVPKHRLRAVNDLPVRDAASWVVYWMTAFRRVHWNFALQHARDWAVRLERPLLVLEPLRTRYRWASDRMHRFVIEGMLDNQLDIQSTRATYYPYVERRAGEGSGLLQALAEEACLVVTDDYPCFFHPRMIRAVQHTLRARLELVDSNCLMPLAALDRTFTVAHSYRRVMQKTLPGYLDESPQAKPLQSGSMRRVPGLAKLPASIARRWPPAKLDQLLTDGGLSQLDIDHSVAPAAMRGGSHAGRARLKHFLGRLLPEYGDDRNHPDRHASSHLSAYLHFGHIAAHEVFWSLMETCNWHPGRLSKPNGSAEGFWNVGQSAEAFLDQLCTWREIGFNMCWREPNYDRYESLPAWAQETLAQHAADPRPHMYSIEQLEQSQTADPLWNAAQRELVRDGRIHNYLRMLWGKRILEWTPTPQQALDTMIELNNKFALDGRDPNSYSGIFWVLGRYDRAWGPERPIFGKVRYMSSENTARKVRLKAYLERYS